MKQRTFTFLLTIFLSIQAIDSFAYDIKVVNADGVTIYFNFLNDNTELEVSSSSYSYNSYTDNVVIPAYVTYSEKTYPVTSIGEKAFYDCKNLTSVTIPNSVTTIGEKAFYYCRNLISITVPNSVTTIGSSAFSFCERLTSITIPDGVTSIGEYTFQVCSGLTSINIPNSVTTIGDFAFQNCSRLTSITIPNNVTSIGEKAFSGCSHLISINIPDGVTSIGDYAFEECSSLYTITIPDGVTTIGNSVFKRCSGLNSITIPNSVTTIGSSAFVGCSGLTSITIPNSVTTIGSSAFGACNRLTSITIPNSVTSIGENAFSGCAMTSITLPNSVTTIDYGTFVGCIDLTSIIIPNSVTTIGDFAFQNCSHLISINIPNSVTTIGDYVFSNCKRLTSITIPNGVTTIGISAFANCFDLTSITIPDGVTSIGDGAFRNSGLTSITIPNSMTTIGKEAFMYCNHLTSITIPDGVTTIGSGAFQNSGLKSITIPNGVTMINEFSFKDCYNLKTANLPDNLKIIKVASFSGCSNLKSITIPATVEYIYEEVFAGCKSLDTITVLPTTPPVLYDNSFSDYSVPLTVPGGSIEAYRNAKGWKNFDNISGDGTYTLTYILDGEVYSIYRLKGGTVITPEPSLYKDGYTFSGWSEIPETMPAHNVTITGTFTANKYKLTYIVGGNEFKTYEVEYGASINQEAFPEQEGYTFSGWSDIPETMPAHDVTVTGSFTVNTYTLSYMVDSEVYKTEDYVYGTAITPENEPEKEGYTFSGWSEIPETMPAHDVTITGHFERHYDIGNVASVIDFILNENYNEGNLELYDMNKDGELNIGDLILIVRKVLDSASKTMTSRTDVECIMPDLAQYTAAQFVVNVPRNVREQDIRLTRDVAKTHQMMCRQIEPGRYAVVIYSLTNSKFAAEGSSFIEVDTEDVQSVDVDVHDVVLARHTGETARFGKLPIATAIADVKREEAHSAVYDLKGRKQEKSSQRGVYIMNGKKIVVR